MQSYAIADFSRRDDQDVFKRIETLFESGIDYVQVRAKERNDREVLHLTAEVLRLRSSSSGSGTKVLVNGRADITVAAGADGVHLPASGVTAAAARTAGAVLIGRSCHSVAEVEAAASEGADYVLFGPLFPTRSKRSPATASYDELRAATRCGVPLFVLGGISIENLKTLAGSGIAGVAGITLFMHDEPVENVVQMVRTLSDYPACTLRRF